MRRPPLVVSTMLLLTSVVSCGMRFGGEVITTTEKVIEAAAPAGAAGAPAHAFLQGRVASKLFGRFTYTINGDGTITQDPRWVRRYIATKRVPILGSVACHRMLFPQLVGALHDLEMEGLAGLIDVADFRDGGGCYVPRQQLWDPKLPLSMHAWGLALDINVERNAYGAAPTQDARIVAAFERWGFRWGGRWSPPDGMHFELAALLKR